MAGIEPRIYCDSSDHSSNCGPTTAPSMQVFTICTYERTNRLAVEVYKILLIEIYSSSIFFTVKVLNPSEVENHHNITTSCGLESFLGAGIR